MHIRVDGFARFGALAFLTLMLTSVNVNADVVADSCKFYRASESDASDAIRHISSLHEGDVIKICEIRSGLRDYLILSKVDGGPLGLCHYVERRVFKPSKSSQRWTLLPPKSESYLAVPADLMFASREPCPSPSGRRYTRVADVSPELALRFLNFWNHFLADEALRRDALANISADRQRDEFYKEFLDAMTQNGGREIKIESFWFRREGISRYQAVVGAQRRFWFLLLDMRDENLTINDVQHLIE